MRPLSWRRPMTARSIAYLIFSRSNDIGMTAARNRSAMSLVTDSTASGLAPRSIAVVIAFCTFSLTSCSATSCSLLGREGPLGHVQIDHRCEDRLLLARHRAEEVLVRNLDCIVGRIEVHVTDVVDVLPHREQVLLLIVELAGHALELSEPLERDDSGITPPVRLVLADLGVDHRLLVLAVEGPSVQVLEGVPIAEPVRVTVPLDHALMVEPAPSIDRRIGLVDPLGQVVDSLDDTTGEVVQCGWCIHASGPQCIPGWCVGAADNVPRNTRVHRVRLLGYDKTRTL